MSMEEYSNIPDKYETGSAEEQQLWNEAVKWAAENPDQVTGAANRFRSWRNRRKAANMARRCAKGKPRANDVCNGRNEGDGTDGSDSDFLGFEQRKRERAGRRRQRQIFRAAKRLPGAQLTQNGMVRPGAGLAPSANGANGNGVAATDWWMNPWIWAAAAGGAWFLWGQKK